MRKKPTEPLKYDGEKLRIELVPPELIEAAARGLGFGARKYSAGNWATGSGFKHSRLYGGLQRHLNSYWGGEDIDPESGNHHLDHAACMLAFLIAHVRRAHGEDDRIEIGVKVGKATNGKPRARATRASPATPAAPRRNLKTPKRPRKVRAS